MMLSIQNYLRSSPCALKQYCTSSASAVEVVYILWVFLGLAHASLYCFSIKINGSDIG